MFLSRVWIRWLAWWAFSTTMVVPRTCWECSLAAWSKSSVSSVTTSANDRAMYERLHRMSRRSKIQPFQFNFVYRHHQSSNSEKTSIDASQFEFQMSCFVQSVLLTNFMRLPHRHCAIPQVTRAKFYQILKCQILTQSSSWLASKSLL